MYDAKRWGDPLTQFAENMTQPRLTPSHYLFLSPSLPLAPSTDHLAHPTLPTYSLFLSRTLSLRSSIYIPPPYVRVISPSLSLSRALPLLALFSTATRARIVFALSLRAGRARRSYLFL